MTPEVKQFQHDAIMQMAKETHEYSLALLNAKTAKETVEITEKYQFRLTFFMDCTKTFEILERNEYRMEQELKEINSGSL
jgi:hypothetical protein